MDVEMMATMAVLESLSLRTFFMRGSNSQRLIQQPILATNISEVTSLAVNLYLFWEKFHTNFDHTLNGKISFFQFWIKS